MNSHHKEQLIILQAKNIIFNCHFIKNISIFVKLFLN